MRGGLIVSTALALSALAACAGGATDAPLAAAPADPVAALRPYYAAADWSLPRAPAGRALPSSSTTLQTILFGSCHTAEEPIPILDRVAADGGDLFVYLGDNVYGDARAGDMRLPELRRQYELLASREEFQRLRAAVPTIATWDDHDYGLNDAGGDFSAKELAERIFETFWGTSERTGAYPGVYDAYVFGPEGRRVQILLLDTRFDRTELSREGRAYVPSTDPNQRMLSDAQWAWLADRLREPAELRIIASSIQILADGHRFEAWQTMPLEQQRLYRTIGESGAQGVVFVSGDRHIGGLYRDEGLIGYPAYELTTSSLNLSFRQTSDERSNTQMGDMYAPVNYGAMRIDWEGRTLTMEVRDAEGAAVRSQTIAFDEIGAG